MKMKATSGRFTIAVFAGITLCVPASAQKGYCAMPAFAPLIQPQPRSIEGATTYIYKSLNGVDLRLHVFAPPHRGLNALPAIVFFYGGGWMWGSVTEDVPVAQYLSGRGMVAIVADYRVFCRNNADVTEQMADARSAIRWVRAHSRELRINPDRIVASGGSSGGHLALSTAVFSDPDEGKGKHTVTSRPNALLLYYPCVDLTTDDERKYSSAALGNHGEDVSPLFHISGGLPPMLIFQGTSDELYASVNQYCAEVRKGGGRCEFTKYEGAPHGFFKPTVNGGKWYREALRETDHFLTRLGYLSTPAPNQVP